MLKDLKFPKNFLWGTSTSAYQVEGNIKCDWSEWETSKERIEQLKKEGKNPKNFINKKACNHYNLYNKDFNLAKQLHNNAHRFSVEWARIEPEQDKFNQKEIDHYKKVIKALKAKKLEPFLTAYHFTLPLWISNEGGWLNRKTPKYFEDYVSRLVNEFRDIKFWITINEPMVITYKCYWQGGWPPNSKNTFKFFRATRNLIKAHRRAYKVIHELPNKQVGIAKSLMCFLGPLMLSDSLYNWYFIDNIQNHQDFIGMNYYTRKRWPPEKEVERSDMGWAICPKGLYALLRCLKDYKVPIYITENGIADSTDKKRGRYIVKHLKQVHNAIQEGIPIKGYFYWSLIDNFEWDQGFTKKFGLVKIDYKNMKREPRKSFYTYKQICKENKINKELQKKFL